MSISVLGESLKMAVDEAFEVEEVVKNQILEQAAGFSIVALNGVLEFARLNQQPGLRETVARAYMSGDDEEIAKTLNMANEQAEAGIWRNAARIAVQNTQKDSRMKRKHSKFKRLGI